MYGNSPVISTATNMSGNGTVSNGATTATSYFSANLTSAPADTGYTNLTSSATVSKSGQTVTAAVTFSASVPTIGAGLAGCHDRVLAAIASPSKSLPSKRPQTEQRH